ncbi:MAG TPA: aminotransferase class III-fold pyridoxal phosphate-dependent enzyme, partial [Pyrinomonadaceae bacterium]|nr:aminotransferase class III-fold pyridoxal phosphate-dependent enzyme [Pyrinomonadaceae bacterium]
MSTVERVIAEQLRLLQNSFRDVAAQPAAAIPEKRVMPQNAKVPEEPAHRPSIDVGSKAPTVVRSGFVPYTPIRPWDDARGNGKAQQHLKQLVTRLTAKSKQSKELTQLHRGRLADNRASAGFRFSVKEMLYPIIGHRSHGSRIWDVDGNEYLDLTMGFGVNLFGHNPPFVTEAIAEQFALGMQLGPQSELAGEVAELVCEFTGMDRAVFVNSGTEAVMTAVRLARTATGRKKVVVFAGSYHGTFDGVLGKPKSDGCEAEPIAPGVPPSMVQDVVVLDYGDPRSLDIIRKIGHECACVLVEPVQSRRPDLQPRQYLRDLRMLASELDIALIFDEVITGFRVAPGGAQEVFGVKADLATYGKVLGGGMPIGAVAGTTRFLDGIDGGHWSYGDASYPGATTTFFAGTFCKHPLTMAAARAVLKHLRAQGPSLQRELNDRTLGFSATLNTFFEKEDVPLRISNFGSLFRFSYANNLDLLFYNLLDRGIYVWEGRNCFLSTAHSKQDVDTIVGAVQDTICQLKADGILESSRAAGHAGVISEKTAARSLPLTDAQKLLWTLTQVDERASVAYNVPVGLEMQGPLDVALLVKAINHVVQQHEALRTTVSADGEWQVIADQLEIECPVEDLSALHREHKSERKAEWIRAQAAARFDLNAGPLLRASLLKTGSTEHLLILTAHHMVTDGWSMGILVGQVCASYSALAGGRAPELGKGLQFSEYAGWLAQKSQAATRPDDRKYWLNEFSAGIPELILPTSKAGLVDRS